MVGCQIAGTTAIALMATTKSSRRTIKSTNENTTYDSVNVWFRRLK
jgi:hypothetical protein